MACDQILFENDLVLPDGLLRYTLFERGGKRELVAAWEGTDGRVCRAVLNDLGSSRAACLRFARLALESGTHPRVLPELWEEYEI